MMNLCCFSMFNFLNIFVDVLPRQTMPIIFVPGHKYANKCTLATCFTAKHCYLNALLHVSQNIAIKSQLCEETVLLSSTQYLLDLKLCILVSSHVE